MTIKKAHIKDAIPLTQLTLRSKAYWNYSNEQMNEWEEELTITEEYILENEVIVLKDIENYVGFYAFKAINTHEVKLNFAFIDPPYIGKGYGKRMINDVFNRVEENGYKSVVLDADPNAKVFYEKMGFKEIGKLKSSIKDRFLPIMKKDLN